MIDIYDGNNVMLRALTTVPLKGMKSMSLRERYQHAATAPAGTQIWCWDGFAHNERRRDLYPRYKTNRTPMAEDMFAQIKLWKEMLTHSPAIQVECEGWEADDVVSTLARQFAARGTAVTLHTNDLDYRQLEELPTVTINGILNGKGVPPKWIPLYKATMGDASDFIAGIPGFGAKAWTNLAEAGELEQFQRAVVAGDPAGFVGLTVTKQVATWLSIPKNVAELQNMLAITYFINVPDDELSKGLQVGVPNLSAADSLLTRYFL
jgi:5'-3' exonuclease